MNKTELADAVAEKSGLTKADAKRAVDALFDAESGVITETLQEGDRVQITGFGAFETRERSARTGRNPQTGEQMYIPATKNPAFKSSKKFKDAIG